MKKKKEDGEFQIVGDFSALNAWKEANEKEYKTFFELAEKAPEVFGISCSALINSGFYNEEGDLVMLEDEFPQNEETKIYAFCEKVLSWDVVSTPATNPNGLFSQKEDQFNKEKITMETEEIQEKDINEIDELNGRISSLETEIETLMDLAKELRNENETLAEQNVEYEVQIEKLESKVESFEIGSEPLDHGYQRESLDLNAQVKNEKDWNVKYKLILDNLSSFSISQEEIDKNILIKKKNNFKISWQIVLVVQM